MFADRLKKIIQITGYSMRRFAKEIGVSPSTLHEYIKGRIPPADLFVRICERFNVSEAWLLTGEGPMLKGQEGPKVVDIKDIPKEQIKEFIEDFWQNADEKERIWFEVQFKMAFPMFSEWLQKNSHLKLIKT